MIIFEGFQQFRMIVTQWNWWDLCVNIKQHIAIDVDQVVSLRFIVISEQLHRSGILDNKNKFCVSQIANK